MAAARQPAGEPFNDQFLDALKGMNMIDRTDAKSWPTFEAEPPGRNFLPRAGMLLFSE